MTATHAVTRASSPRRWSFGGRSERLAAGETLPPLGPRLQLMRGIAVMVAVASLAALLHLLVLSDLHHRAAQARALDTFRLDLARGVAPVGPTDAEGTTLALGTPVALLEIPSIGVREVVGEGTTPGVLFDGPGHRRDTVLPGQEGTSIIMGRRAAYGGPFADLASLDEGDTITVTTGNGVFEFRVSGVRYEGDPAPPALAAGEARLTLITATGTPYLADGAVRVDADLQGDAVGAVSRQFDAAGLPAAERVMGADGRTVWVLALWLQGLLILSLAFVWSWHRWGRSQAWIALVPPLLLFGVLTAGEAARLLPNLL